MEKLQKEVAISDFLRDCVDIPTFSVCCQACSNYGKIWSCPPFAFEPMELWNHYGTLLLESRKIAVPADLRQRVFTPEEMNDVSRALLYPEKRAMLLELLELEKQHPGSMALAAGSCDFCSEGCCSRQRQEPCRDPDRMRYSVEALGGDVGKTLKLYFGQTLQWGRDGYLPEYFILLGGLLKKPADLGQAKEMGYHVW